MRKNKERKIHSHRTLTPQIRESYRVYVYIYSLVWLVYVNPYFVWFIRPTSKISPAVIGVQTF